MLRIYSLRDLPLASSSVITIGAFDGIHLGHRALFQEVLKGAVEKGCLPLVVTFNPHPRKVLQPHLHLKLLTTLEEKLELIEKEGFSQIVLLPFNTDIAELSPEIFVERYLVDLLKSKEVVIGFNFRFGRSRLGDSELLRRLGDKYDFAVKVVSPVKIGERTVSSTQIRELLNQGDVETANQMLGRNYTFSGKVISGKGRGKQLGFPTANLLPPPEKLIPGRGVYAVWVYVKSLKYKGALNIGFNPTFGDKNLSVEVHILDFEPEGNLYNQTLKIEFVKFIRGEKKFFSPQELIRQINQDCKLIRKILS